MQDFSFSADDLRANRTGKLSQAQRAVLENKRRSTLTQVGVGVGVFVVLLAFSCRALQSARHLNDLFLPVVVLSIVFVAIIGVRLRDLHIHQDMQHGEVVSVRGPLNLSEETTLTNERRIIAEVGEAQFAISESLMVTLKDFQAHMPGNACVFYYTPGSKTILSFEAIEGAPPPPPARKLSLQEALARQHAEEEARYGK